MSDMYDYDTDVYGDSEEIESTHTDNEYRNNERCDFCLEIIWYLERWMNDACDDIQYLDLASRETLVKHFQLLNRHLIDWQ